MFVKIASMRTPVMPFILLILISLTGFCQYNVYETQAGTAIITPPRHHNPKNPKPAAESENYVSKVEKRPEFPGGQQGMNRFLDTSLVYPARARSLNISGKVFIGFMVKTDGSISDIQVMRGIGGGCDEEAMRLVRLMPKWKPGETNGKPTDAVVVIPISFENFSVPKN